MNNDEVESILLEILRIGLIASRNLVCVPRTEGVFMQMASEWASLCHSLPAILLGKCNVEAVRYFYAGDGVAFLKSYPRKEDADYKQIVNLLEEIRERLEV